MAVTIRNLCFSKFWLSYDHLILETELSWTSGNNVSFWAWGQGDITLDLWSLAFGHRIILIGRGCHPVQVFHWHIQVISAIDMFVCALAHISSTLCGSFIVKWLKPEQPIILMQLHGERKTLDFTDKIWSSYLMNSYDCLKYLIFVLGCPRAKAVIDCISHLQERNHMDGSRHQYIVMEVLLRHSFLQVSLIS